MKTSISLLVLASMKSIVIKMKYLLISLFLFFSISTFGQNLTGEWNGLLKLTGLQLRMILHITKTDAGYSATMDSPDQGAIGIPMSNTTFENSVLTVELTTIQFKYTGKLDSTGIMVGTFTQAGYSVPMNLFRALVSASDVTSASDVKDTAFIETEIILQTESGKIYGTLTTPKKYSKIPVALIIAGSGPTNRDGNQTGLQSNAYKKLAYGLAENNIASLRYDKRGVAKSIGAAKKESDLRFEDYVNDAKDWIRLLKQDKRFSKVIVIGHSEGSLIGLIAAPGADKFVTIAGAGQSVDKIIKEQFSKEPKENKDLTYSIIDSLKNGKIVNNVDPNPNYIFRLSVQPYIISWIKYDTQIEISKLKIPVLILQGTNDLQVTVDDAKRLSKANPKASLVLIENMNHVFRIVGNDTQANKKSYSDPSLPISDQLVKSITDFILKN